MHLAISPRQAGVGVWAAMLASVAVGATSEQLDTARDQALAWLVRTQQADGSWRKQDATVVQSSALTLDALARFGVKGVVANRGLSWLANAPTPNIDALSRSLGTLGDRGLDGTRHANDLLQWGDPVTGWAGWGGYPQYRASSPDTALAMLALVRGKVAFPKMANSVNLLVVGQQADGGWGYGTLDKVWTGSGLEAASGSDIVPTTLNLMALSALKAKHPQPASLNNGLNWLVAQQKASGGLGNGGGTVLETALTAQLLMTERGGADANLLKAQDFLITQQATDGSWGGDPLLTASVLLAFPAKLLPDTDRDGLPDSIEALLNTSPTTVETPAAVDNGRAVAGINYQYGYERYLTLNKPFSDTLPLRGIAQVNRWKLLTGKLPTGIKLDEGKGTLSGTPNSKGRYEFRYQVANAAGDTKAVAGVMVVTPGIDKQILQLLIADD